MASLGLAVLRLALAAVFVAHGANKLFGTWAGPAIGPGGLTNTAAFLAALGFHPEFPVAVLVGVTELAGGALLAAGFLTRYAAAALLTEMVVAFWRVHLHWGFFLNWTGASGRGQGLEYSLVLAAALLCLVLAGAGGISFDGRRESRSASRAAARARLRGKV